VPSVFGRGVGHRPLVALLHGGDACRLVYRLRRELFLALIMAIGPLRFRSHCSGSQYHRNDRQNAGHRGALEDHRVRHVACQYEDHGGASRLVPDVETNIKLLVLNFFFAFLTIFAAPIGAWLISGQLAAVAGLAASAATAKLMLAGANWPAWG